MTAGIERYRRGVGAAVASSAGPCGYTLAIWTSASGSSSRSAAHPASPGEGGGGDAGEEIRLENGTHP